MGEKLSKAGLNTLISISIVFCVLILISLIIYAFNIFPYLENKKKEKEKAAAATPKDEVVSQIQVREEQQNVTDDTELIAVIAAAIAASEGTSTSDFVVRSINRR
jgi:Na+-transporting methylmalonyl-CoA/oxaloacetate decarboxylase gamma subunit